VKNYKSFPSTLITFIITFLSCSIAGYGQNKTDLPAKSDSSSAIRNSLKPDTWALEFGINPNFTLNSFQGSVLSIKRQLNSREAIQLGIGGSLNNETGDGSNQDNYADTLNVGTTLSGVNNRGSVQINLQYVYYANPDDDIIFFAGAGPTAGYSWYTHNDDYSPVLPLPVDSTISVEYPSSADQKQTSWNAGASGMIGVECFILKFLSVHAQYGISVTYNESNYIYDYSYKTLYQRKVLTTTHSNQNKYHGWQINPNSVLFGLSVYFK
jgi:hypothetical protein